MNAICNQPEVNYDVMSLPVIRDLPGLHLSEFVWVSVVSDIYARRRRRQVHLSPIFGVKEQTYLAVIQAEMKPVNKNFKNLKTFSSIRLTVIEKSGPEHDPK